MIKEKAKPGIPLSMRRKFVSLTRVWGLLWGKQATALYALKQ